MFSMLYKKLHFFLLLFATHSPAPTVLLPFVLSQLSPRFLFITRPVFYQCATEAAEVHHGALWQPRWQ